MNLPALTLLLLSLSMLLPHRAEALTVFAAASLRDVLAEVADGFTEDTGETITLVPAGSSALARQIVQGAPADLVILANRDWMQVLEEGGLLATPPVNLLSNRLALIAHKPLDPIDLNGPDAFPEEGRIAMALVDAVPVGIYGRAALQSLGLWSAVRPRVVQTDNARSALAQVALGAVPFGIVYATDAHAEPRVTLLGLFPQDGHPPILYPAAALSDAPEALAFLTHLQGHEARAIFESHGFAVLAD